jgi:hypothetical protein
MADASLPMAFMFATHFEGQGDGGCVGAGGLFPIRVREDRVGRAVHAVYAADVPIIAPAPGREYGVELVVDELEVGEGFVPVAVTMATAGLDPALCRQEGGEVTQCIFNAESGMYTNWDASNEPIHPSEFEVPALCYTGQYTEGGVPIPRVHAPGHGGANYNKSRAGRLTPWQLWKLSGK